MSRKSSTSSDLSSISFSSTSCTSVTSSSPEPSIAHVDTAGFYQLILELEGWPNDYTGRQLVIKLLLEKSCRVIKHCTTDPTVHDLVRELSWPQVLEQLAHLGAKIADRNCRGDTALHLGFVNDAADSRVFDALLDNYLHHATDNFRNVDRLSLLHIACAKSSLEVVRQLLQLYPEDINLQVALKTRTPFSGYTPLHFAVLHGRHDIAKLLLDSNADFCARDSKCITPLHLALYCEDVEMIDLILSYDRKWENCVNNFGLSHLMAACAGSNPAVVQKFIFVSNYMDRIPPSTLVKFSVLSTTNYPFAGYQPLHFAAENGNVDTVQLLLECGASTYTSTSSNYTPTALASMEGHDDVCRMLQLYSNSRIIEAINFNSTESMQVHCSPISRSRVIGSIVGFQKA